MLTTCNGVALYVEEAGADEPLVLVHGSWDDVRIWGQIREPLARHFRVVCYDRRGHTGSEDAPGTRRDDEDDLAALIETLGLTPAHVVGNSFGGAIALGLAGRRPELFRTLCVHEPPLVSLAPDDPAVAGVADGVAPLVDLIARGEHETAAREFIDNVVIGPGAWAELPEEERAALAGNAHTFLGEQRDPAWADIDVEALRRLELPVLLTRGEESPPFLRAIVERLEAILDGADVVEIPGAGHVPHETHPAEYAAVVERFAVGAGAVR
jgi:pimeloyl-ACP methyl ester carboxylesterase